MDGADTAADSSPESFLGRVDALTFQIATGEFVATAAGPAFEFSIKSAKNMRWMSFWRI